MLQPNYSVQILEVLDLTAHNVATGHQCFVKQYHIKYRIVLFPIMEKCNYIICTLTLELWRTCHYCLVLLRSAEYFGSLTNLDHVHHFYTQVAIDHDCGSEPVLRIQDNCKQGKPAMLRERIELIMTVGKSRDQRSSSDVFSL